MRGIPLSICCHDDWWYLSVALSVPTIGPKVVFISRQSWWGEPGAWEECAAIAERSEAEVVLGDWQSESDHRRYALEEMRRKGFRHILIPDSDEIIDPELIIHLEKIASHEISDLVFVGKESYWKSHHYRIRPQSSRGTPLMVDCRTVEHVKGREYAGKLPLTLGNEYGLIHNLSYTGPDYRVARKLMSCSRRGPIVPGWYGNVWLAWDNNPLLRNLHPGEPQRYGYAERLEPPPALSRVPELRPHRERLKRPVDWPKVSIVIQHCSAFERLQQCLESLSSDKSCDRFKELFHEVIVISEDTMEPINQNADLLSFTKLRAVFGCQGKTFSLDTVHESCEGEVILFLGSEARATESGLIRLIGSLMDSADVGAVGPMTNHARYAYQQAAVAYSSSNSAEAFADDFAFRDASDEDVSAVDGFCMAVRKSTLNEIGGFDPAMGNGLVGFEEFCYRIQRSGSRVVVSGRSFIHHELLVDDVRTVDHPVAQQLRHRVLFEEKWRQDLECNFASHLPGQQEGLTTFDNERKPETLKKAIRELAANVDISLCMIVTDEDRPVRESLQSVVEICDQVVVVDARSTTDTTRILEGNVADAIVCAGALCEYVVVHHEWRGSFAVARNESLDHATCDWILRLDTDETLPLLSAEQILRSVNSAPQDVTAFSLWVETSDDKSVDRKRDRQARVFRNSPNFRFEGRVHEELNCSVRGNGGRVIPLAAHVARLNRNTNKEERLRRLLKERRLLALALADCPNASEVSFYLGVSANSLGRKRAAIGWLKRSLIDSGLDSSRRGVAHSLIGCALRDLGRLEESLLALQEARDKTGSHPDVRFQTALTLTALGRLEDARMEYLAIEDTCTDLVDQVDIGVLGYKRLHNLGSLSFEMGQYLTAKKYWLAAGAANPKWALSCSTLFAAAMSVGDLQCARESAERLRVAAGENEEWARMEAQIAIAEGINPEVRLLELMSQRHTATAPGLLVARALLDRGNVSQAIPLLRTLERRGSGEAAALLAVSCSRSGNLTDALFFFQRAAHLEPTNMMVREQITVIEEILSANHG